MGRVAAIMKWIGLGLAALMLTYTVAGLVGGALPANAGWREPALGVLIHVEDNGVHTGLVLPRRAAGVDWSDLARADDLADPRYASDTLAFGWGDHDSYLNTPRWRDVRPRTVLAAAIGSHRTLLHVEHITPPVAGARSRPIRLRPAEYRRLAAFIRATARPGVRRHWPGYGPNDVFYEANGQYSAFRTCNAWTGEALRAAGVRVGRWTPFVVTVMAWF